MDGVIARSESGGNLRRSKAAANARLELLPAARERRRGARVTGLKGRTRNAYGKSTQRCQEGHALAGSWQGRFFPNGGLEPLLSRFVVNTGEGALCSSYWRPSLEEAIQRVQELPTVY